MDNEILIQEDGDVYEGSRVDFAIYLLSKSLLINQRYVKQVGFMKFISGAHK